MDEEFETTPNSSQGRLIEVRWDDRCNQSEQHRQLCFHVQRAWIQGDMGPELHSYLKVDPLWARINTVRSTLSEILCTLWPCTVLEFTEHA